MKKIIKAVHENYEGTGKDEPFIKREDNSPIADNVVVGTLSFDNPTNLEYVVEIETQDPKTLSIVKKPYTIRRLRKNEYDELVVILLSEMEKQELFRKLINGELVAGQNDSIADESGAILNRIQLNQVYMYIHSLARVLASKYYGIQESESADWTHEGGLSLFSAIMQNEKNLISETVQLREIAF